jgi:predicted alpha/beta superfamily hydrolase
MRRLTFVLGIAAAFALVVYAGWRLRQWRQAEEEQRLRKLHTLHGTVVKHDFHSEALGEDRRVWVYLPPMYEREPDRRFPVLYMQDGQNVFDGATAFVAGKEWEADEAAERLIEEGRIEPLIIVAVDNGGAERTNEYTPTADRHGEGGNVERYARMLVDELKPWIDGEYRTRSGPESTGIAGSSFGGVASLWIGLTHPDVFGLIAAVSTSAARDDGQIVRFVEALPEKPATRIWTDVGTAEGHEALEYARLLHDALVRKGWKEGVDLAYVEAEGAAHNETAWARRLPAILEFFFPPRPEATADTVEVDG